jgi:hypothetical protein
LEVGMPSAPAGASLVFELKRGDTIASWLGIAIGASGIGLLLWGGVAYYRASGDLGGAAGISVFGLVPALFITLGTMGLRLRLRVFESGIEARGVFGGARYVSFDEATSLIWNAYEGRMGRSSTGNFVKGHLASPAAAAGFDVPVARYGPALADLRDRASRAIAARAEGEILRGGSFTWGRARISAQGIEIDGTLLPYGVGFSDEISGIDYRLRRLDTGERVHSMKTRDPNFYPGLALFRSKAGMHGPEEAV